MLERRAVHDNSNLHVAAMGFWALMVARDDSVKAVRPHADDVARSTGPRGYARRPNYGLVVPQLVEPGRQAESVQRRHAHVGDDFFRPARVIAKVGQRVTWRFAGRRPHSVSVANGPRGFSSLYWGRTARDVTRSRRACRASTG